MAEPQPPELDELDEAATGIADDESEDITERGLALLRSPRRLGLLILALIAIVVAIYYFVPKLAGLEGTLHKLDDATWYWIVVAFGFQIASAISLMLLFRAAVGGGPDEEIRKRLDVDSSLQITLAGLAATALFSAAGAGGLALMYWALRKGGLERRRAACRLVAFLCIQYVVYLSALVIFGILLRAGVLPGDNPKGGTIIPAAVAGVILVLIALVARIPGNFDRQVQRLGTRKRFAKFAARIATVPALVAIGVRTAGDIVRDPRRGPPAVFGSIGFWACNIGALWACFHAFGVDIEFGALIQGFFVGTAANLLPSPAGGVGTLDAGLIGSFILFGISKDEVFPVILTYRFAFYWLPIIPGLIMFLRLRGTVHRWEDERKAEGYTSESKVKAEAT